MSGRGARVRGEIIAEDSVVDLATMMGATQTQTRVVVIERSPPKRLMQPLRFRPSKIRYDQDVWDVAMQPVRELVAGGYQVSFVHIEWGKSEPGVPGERVFLARDLTLCYGDSCSLTMTSGQPGRGHTTFELQR